MPGAPRTWWRNAGRFAAGMVGIGSMLAGGVVALVAFASLPQGLTFGFGRWWLGIVATFLTASFGTAYSAFTLAEGSRPQPWPSRGSAAACFLLGLMSVVLAYRAVTVPGRGNMDNMEWVAGVLFLLPGAHALYGGGRPEFVLLLATIVAAFVAYVGSPAYSIYGY